MGVELDRPAGEFEPVGLGKSRPSSLPVAERVVSAHSARQARSAIDMAHTQDDPELRSDEPMEDQAEPLFESRHQLGKEGVQAFFSSLDRQSVELFPEHDHPALRPAVARVGVEEGSADSRFIQNLALPSGLDRLVRPAAA
ncbi:hypothetical protein D3C71_1660310 [compost metagenome]